MDFYPALHVNQLAHDSFIRLARQRLISLQAVQKDLQGYDSRQPRTWGDLSADDIYYVAEFLMGGEPALTLNRYRAVYNGESGRVEIEWSRGPDPETLRLNLDPGVGLPTGSMDPGRALQLFLLRHEIKGVEALLQQQDLADIVAAEVKRRVGSIPPHSFEKFAYADQLLEELRLLQRTEVSAATPAKGPPVGECIPYFSVSPQQVEEMLKTRDSFDLGQYESFPFPFAPGPEIIAKDIPGVSIPEKILKESVPNFSATQAAMDARNWAAMSEATMRATRMAASGDKLAGAPAETLETQDSFDFDAEIKELRRAEKAGYEDSVDNVPAIEKIRDEIISEATRDAYLWANEQSRQNINPKSAQAARVYWDEEPMPRLGHHQVFAQVKFVVGNSPDACQEAVMARQRAMRITGPTPDSVLACIAQQMKKVTAVLALGPSVTRTASEINQTKSLEGDNAS